MSVPISACLLSRAARHEPGARELLAGRAEYNKKFGAFTFFGCSHKPKCQEPTAEQLAELAEAIPDIAPLIAELFLRAGLIEEKHSSALEK